MLNLKYKRKKPNCIKELHCTYTQHCSHCSFRFTVKSELKAANQQQALGIAILLLVLIISPIIIFLVRCVVICVSDLFIIPFVRNATATIHIFSLTLSTKEQVVSCHQWSQYVLLLTGTGTREAENGGPFVSYTSISGGKVCCSKYRHVCPCKYVACFKGHSAEEESECGEDRTSDHLPQ